MSNVIDGQALAATYHKQLKQQVKDLRKKGVIPTLVMYCVGNHRPSERFFLQKQQLGELLDIVVYPRQFDSIKEDDLVKQIENCDDNCEIDGIVVELPLPKHMDTQRVRRSVAVDKDVDGINPSTLGRLVTGKAQLAPATPMAVIEMLKAKHIEISGRDAVVVGRSETVGTPLALMLQREDATITVCNSKTQHLADKTRRADLLCVASGQPGLITGNMVKEGAVVIDIGANATAQGIVGDVEFQSVAPRAKWITPVPGGIGPMASTMVLKNVIEVARGRL